MAPFAEVVGDPHLGERYLYAPLPVAFKVNEVTDLASVPPAEKTNGARQGLCRLERRSVGEVCEQVESFGVDVENSALLLR